MKHFDIFFQTKNLPEEVELQHMFTKCGFYLGDHNSTGATFSCSVTCRDTPKDQSLYKIFKLLNRRYKIKKLTLRDNSPQKPHTTPKGNLITSGSGVRSILTLQGDIIHKEYLDRPEILDTYFHAEIQARKDLGHVKGVVPFVDVGPSFFTMPYIQPTYGYDPEGAMPFPLEKFDQIYAFIETIYQNGYCLVDWNIDSFIFQNDNLYFVDYEYAYKHSNPSLYPTSPDLTGNGQEGTTALDDYVSFDNYWYKLLGITYKQYCTLPRPQLKKLQFKYFLTKKLPHYLSRKINKPINILKQKIRYKITKTPSEIIVTKRGAKV